MSDDAPTPAGDAARDPWPAPAPDGADGPQDAAPKVPLDKGRTADTSTSGTAGTSESGAGSAGSPVAPNPWAAPGDSARSGPGHTIAANETPPPEPAPAPVPPGQAPPAVHDQWTVTALPSVPPPPADAIPQPWATPFGNPPMNDPFGSFPPPYPGTAAAGGPPVNPFGPPGPGGAVPPPPLAPHGPGRIPYGYPGGYGYPTPPSYGGGFPGPYGWPGGAGDSNGMGIAGLVLGIVSAVGFCMWPLAVVLGVLGVTFGAVGRGKARRGEASNPGQALAGIICGSVGIALAIGLGVLVIVHS
ncbi:DUF4190 domain-containing protein [Streptomyces rishiriensis]|uniref:DUF4190 domain-containing protein n=1 Tax=Streptomyces rishiriensis TaxID=68264 RepID=A0ABU0NXA0_STRRH|nr:DUF4190 domain-containing protein [Streptomyces rishiriensis]MDQ0583775.1 hypothetical protein [Streptomyces rishiriensis]